MVSFLILDCTVSKNSQTGSPVVAHRDIVRCLLDKQEYRGCRFLLEGRRESFGAAAGDGGKIAKIVSRWGLFCTILNGGV